MTEKCIDEIGEEMEKKLKELKTIIAEGKEILTKANKRLDKIEQETEIKQYNNFNWILVLLLLSIIPSFDDDVPTETKDEFMDSVRALVYRKNTELDN